MYVTDEKVLDRKIPIPAPAADTERKIVIAEEDEKPQTYAIDTNGNVKMRITLKPMSYKWYVLHPHKEDGFKK